MTEPGFLSDGRLVTSERNRVGRLLPSWPGDGLIACHCWDSNKNKK